jgi:acetylornithine deacetylase/succinyl-diaminopimelate desuccinylase-like protein
MTAIGYAREHQQRFVNELVEFLRIPSVSALPDHRVHVHRAASWLVEQLRTIGLDAEMLPVEGGHPMVYGERREASGRPTVLFYGHYDVQPADPLDAWTSPPFEPTRRGDDLYARGASDDKGQVFGVLKAIESVLRGWGRLPINVKVLVEGEEEIGSPAVLPWLDHHARKISCDSMWVSDGMLFAPGIPVITTGLRGLVYTEVTASGASRDAHSGMHGGAIPNPLNALATIIAGLKDRRGHITVPRFYSPVQSPSPRERADWDQLPFDERQYLRDQGLDTSSGEEGFGILERRWARPTLDVNGIVGGWMNVGAKTVIPAHATAKISMRIVPNQKAKSVYKAFESKVRKLAPPAVRVEVRELAGSDPVLIDPSSKGVQSAAGAIREVWGRDPAYTREGGSIPIVSKFVNTFKIPAILFGFGLPDDGHHAPNERFHLPNFFKGIETVVRFIEEAGNGNSA